MTDKSILPKMSSQHNNGPQSFIVKISRPNPDKDNKPQTQVYRSECICTKEDQADRQGLIELSKALEDQKSSLKEISETEEKDEYLKQKSLIESTEKSFFTHQAKIKSPLCHCWANDIYRNQPEEEYLWSSDEDAPYFMKDNIKFFLKQDGNYYYYNQMGNRIDVIYRQNTTYRLDPLLRKLSYCHWHGGLCLKEKNEMRHDIRIHGFENIVKYAHPYVDEIINGNKIKRYIYGSPPTYGVYVYVDNGIDQDIVCYDSCSDEYSRLRFTESQINDDDAIIVRRFVKGVDQEFKSIAEKIKTFSEFVKKRDSDIRELNVLSKRRDEIDNGNLAETEINNLNIIINNIRSQYNRELETAEMIWLRRVEAIKGNVKSSTRGKKLPPFNEIINMIEPNDDDPDNVLELWNLIVDYNESEEDQESLDLQKEITKKYKEVHKQELEETKESEVDISDRAKQEFISSRQEQTLKDLNKAEKELKSKEAKIEKDRKSLASIKQKILDFNISIIQANDSMIAAAKATYFECKHFLDRANKCINIGRNASFIYDDPDSVILENETEEQIIGRTQEAQTKFQKMLTFIEIRYNSIKNKMSILLLHLKDFSESELEASYSNWKSEQAKFKESRSEKVTENVTIVADITLKEQDLDDIFGEEEALLPQFKDIIISVPQPIKIEHVQEERRYKPEKLKIKSVSDSKVESEPVKQTTLPFTRMQKGIIKPPKSTPFSVATAPSFSNVNLFPKLANVSSDISTTSPSIKAPTSSIKAPTSPIKTSGKSTTSDEVAMESPPLLKTNVFPSKQPEAKKPVKLKLKNSKEEEEEEDFDIFDKDIIIPVGKPKTNTRK